jgi:hypothetical protein
MVTYPPFGSGSQIVRVKEDAVDVSSAGNSDILFVKNDSVKDTGGSSLAFEKGDGMDVDTQTLTIGVIEDFNVFYPDLATPGAIAEISDGFNIQYETLNTQQISDGFNK